MLGKTAFRDTIFALSSGGLPSGVAVVRISGAATRRVLETMAGSLPKERLARLATIRNRRGEILDEGLILLFEAPKSFTGEDCGELHLHGGHAVVRAVLASLGEFDGLRMAEAGEFTRRAFLNGKLDLTRAEGLSDLIASETEAERRLAIATSRGVQQRLYDRWRDELLHARALVEADLDFSDEEDVPGSLAASLDGDLRKLAAEIQVHIGGYRMAEIIRDGFRVVIVGGPNVGKSSLLNAIAGREAAIVTDVPGTTRDIVQISLELGGQRVVMMDTAGLRASNDMVERLGIERAIAAASDADLILELCDVSASGGGSGGLDGIEVERLKIGTKVDLPAAGMRRLEADIYISSLDGTGLDELMAEIGRRASRTQTVGDLVVPTRQRHVAVLQECVLHLQQAAAETEADIKAEELRLASHALGRLTGATDVEEVLGTIFSTFCIGK